MIGVVRLDVYFFEEVGYLIDSFIRIIWNGGGFLDEMGLGCRNN